MASIQFKVEKGRVLVPVGEPCPFACAYCYTRGGEVGPPKVGVEEILQRLQAFANENEFETIQFGYDGDPFARPDRGLLMLRGLGTMGKDVNFSTKASIEGPALMALADIRGRMAASGRTLSALVSLSCWESAPRVEPHTPPPGTRMLTIRNLAMVGIPAFIAVRPILPHIKDGEYERLVDEGLAAGCEGFVLGPLYADEKGRFVRFIPPGVLEGVPGSKVVVPWSAQSPVWMRYEDEDRLGCLSRLVNEKGGRVFLSSVDALEFVGQGSAIA